LVKRDFFVFTTYSTAVLQPSIRYINYYIGCSLGYIIPKWCIKGVG